MFSIASTIYFLEAHFSIRSSEPILNLLILWFHLTSLTDGYCWSSQRRKGERFNHGSACLPPPLGTDF